MRPNPLPAAARALATLLPLIVAIAGAPAHAGPRPADPMNAAEIRLALARLRVTASALYVGAHPDDENTALLAWLANGRGVRTAYLSLTRGDGGQNLIGHELGPALGVIRTQELMAARRIDGAEQMFTRAVDFGFSKNPEESFAIWGRDSVLADVVWAIRRFQPDVIVTRFPTDGRGGHGHHTASAILAEEAFRDAGDPAYFPGQFAADPELQPWQAKRLFWNAWPPDSGRPDSTWLSVDVGAFEPVLGRSWGEMAAASRSNHKSQGFGIAERHGSIVNYLSLREGEPASRDPFEGVDATWSRVPGGAAVEERIAVAQREFDPAHPQALLPRLFEIRDAMLRARSPQAWWTAKRSQVEALIRACTGLWVEAVALRPAAEPGDTLPVGVAVTDRLGVGALALEVRVGGAAAPPGAGPLAPLATHADTLRVAIPATARVTQPYWLALPSSRGLHRVASPLEIGRPESAPALAGEATLRVNGQPVSFPLAVAWKWSDPVQGERWRTLEITPPATLALDQETYLFADRSARPVQVRVQAQRERLRGRVSLELPPGWRAAPEGADIELAHAGDEIRLRFAVTPGDGPAAASITASIAVDGRRWALGLQRIDYPHIPMQTLFPPATARAVRVEVRHTGSRVAYLAGSGDAVAAALGQLGFEVTELTDEQLESAELSRYDAIVTGVRAFNTRPRLRGQLPRLLDYVRAGGTLVEQYNTLAGSGPGELGPYPFKLSSDRVTVEEAPVTFPHPGHALLTRPNAIGAADFDGWVQERGLNFPNPWDGRYETVLSCHDPGEPARDGGLLYARLGRGVFIYCAYAMFRELPAGVPGAWRLFANLVSAR